MRQNLYGGLIEGALITQLKIANSGNVTLGGALVLGVKSEPIQILDPGGTNRNVDLPAEASSEDLVFIILNTASSTENLVVRNDSGTTIATLTGVTGGTNNGRGIFVCDGTTWRGMSLHATL